MGALRDRLLKWQNKLFTFIRHDSVPWNNNNAENAIKQFAYYREDTAEWDEAGEGYSAKGRAQIREAVALERTRLWDSHPRGKEAETGLGREIQKGIGAASVVVNRIVRQAARKRLESKEGEGKKPN